MPQSAGVCAVLSRVLPVVPADGDIRFAGSSSRALTADDSFMTGAARAATKLSQSGRITLHRALQRMLALPRVCEFQFHSGDLL